MPPLSSRASTAWVWARPGPHHQLGRREDLRRRRRVAASWQKKIDIGAKHAGEGRRQVAGVGLRVDDLAEHRLGGRELAAAREIAGEPRLGVEKRRGARIIGFEQSRRPAGRARRPRPCSFCSSAMAREVAEDLRAHPRDRGDPAVAHRLELRVGAAAARRVAPARSPVEAQRGAAQLQRLAVEDLRLFRGQQLVRLGAELLAELGLGSSAAWRRGADVDAEPSLDVGTVARRPWAAACRAPSSASSASPWLSSWIAR